MWVKSISQGSIVSHKDVAENCVCNNSSSHTHTHSACLLVMFMGGALTVRPVFRFAVFYGFSLCVFPTGPAGGHHLLLLQWRSKTAISHACRHACTCAALPLCDQG